MSTVLQRSCHLRLQGRLQSRTVHFHQAELGLVQLSSLIKTGLFCWCVSFVYFLFLFFIFIFYFYFLFFLVCSICKVSDQYFKKASLS